MIRWWIHLGALVLLLAGCDAGQPLRLGFIGPMTGHYADFGITGRNGALLAVEQRNQAGGVNGRPVELLIRDDAQTPETAIQAVQELLAAQIEALIGPVTSEMVDAVLPTTEAAGLIVVSPTSAATQFAGKDDHFFRLASTSREYARDSATFYYHQLGLRRIAIIYDLRNRAFSESTREEFDAAFSALGGKIVLALPFESTVDTRFTALVETLLNAQPDALLLVTSALDTVRLCQQARKQAPHLPLIATVWAATEQLIELGGRDVEGLYLAQIFNRYDPSPRYQAFYAAYRQRFQQEPGFVSLAAYDAVNVVLDTRNNQPLGQSLKDGLLNGSFTGAQQPIVFDRFGDARRQSFITVIHQGRFVVAQ